MPRRELCRNGADMEENILLTITMLVSDREDTIEKCMESLVHLREAVPSELIVVDTAGNEKCMEIVRRYTDNIVRFEWINDFAAARNAGVKKAKGKWLMFLDDDEWFENTEELEDFFLSGKFKEYNGASYVVRNYLNSRGTTWQDMDAVRLAKRSPATCFKGKVHEHLSPMTVPVCYLKDYVHHYGYVFQNQQEKNEHAWRNIRLLLEIRKKDPDDCHNTAQLIQEYQGTGDEFSAIELCKELRNRRYCWKTLERRRYTTYAVMMETKLYLKQQRFQECYQVCGELLAQPDLPLLARGVLLNQMVTCCYRLEKYGEALDYIDRFQDACAKWEDYPDKKLEDGFSQCGEYLEKSEVQRMALLGLHFHVALEDWEAAESDLQSVDWAEKQKITLRETPKDVVCVLGKAPFCEQYLPAVRFLSKNNKILADTYREIERSGPEGRSTLLQYLSLLPPTDSRLCQYHLEYAATVMDIGLAVVALEKMKESRFPFFLTKKTYWNSLRRLDIHINSYLTEINTYEWIGLARSLWSKSSLETCEDAYFCLSRDLDKTDIRYIFLSGLMLEKQLLEAIAPQPDTELQDAVPKSASQPLWLSYTTDQLWEKLNQLSQYWVSCAASLYREDVFMGELIQAIPPSYRFGWYIMQANAVKDKDHNLFLRKVTDAAKTYPAMKEVCKRLIKMDEGQEV